MSSEGERKIIELLTLIANWSRFSGIQAAREVLTQTMQHDSEKLAYHYSDGRASREIAKLSGLSDFTIRSYWKKWNSMGLVFPSTKFKGRYERAFSLDEFGIELPTLKVVSEGPQEAVPEQAESEQTRGIASE